MGEAPPVSGGGVDRASGSSLLLGEWTLGFPLAPHQEPWILTTGVGGAFKGLEMT